LRDFQGLVQVRVIKNVPEPGNYLTISQQLIRRRNLEDLEPGCIVGFGLDDVWGVER
jgi:hypothetical protein